MITFVVETDNTDRAFDLVREGLGDAIKDLLYLGEEEAKFRAPVKTGALKAGIHRDDSRVDSELEGTIESALDLEYPIYQELGTYKMAAQPHMLPAGNQIGKISETVTARRISEKLDTL